MANNMMISSIIDSMCFTPRCALTYKTDDGLKITAVHLCGGRYDDEEYQTTFNGRRQFMQKIIDEEQPDIIMGDFNSDSDEARYLHSVTTYEPALKPEFRKWQMSVYDPLEDNKYKQIFFEGITTPFGTQVDSIFVKEGLFAVTEQTIVTLEKPEEISDEDWLKKDGPTDHYGVYVKLTHKETNKDLKLLSINLFSNMRKKNVGKYVSRFCTKHKVDLIATQETGSTTIPHYKRIGVCLPGTNEEVAFYKPLPEEEKKPLLDVAGDLEDLFIANPDKIISPQPPKVETEEKTKEDEEGCIRAKEAGIGGLLHETSEANAIRIFQSWKLITGRELDELEDQPYNLFGKPLKKSLDSNQFVGVYMEPFRVNEPTRMSFYTPTDVALIFSVALLDRDDYHMNLEDQNGYLTHISYAPENLKEVLTQNWNNPEIVFHNPVSLDYLQGIFVQPDQYVLFKNRLQEVLSPNRFSEILPLLRVYDRRRIGVPPQPWCLHCERVNQWSHRPRFCSIYPKDDIKTIMPDIHAARKIAENCGILLPDEVAKLDYKQLQSRIFEREKELIKTPNKIIYPAPHLPPFKPSWMVEAEEKTKEDECKLKNDPKTLIWIENLSVEEREAIGQYMDSSIFINKAFRLGKPDLSEAEEVAWDAWNEKYYHDNIADHYRAFKTLKKMSETNRFLKLPFDITLYRAVKTLLPRSPRSYKTYCNFEKKGYICVDKAPLSTSITWKGASLTQDSSTLIILHVPRNTPLIPIYLVEGDETQKEVLLGPNLKLQFQKNCGVLETSTAERRPFGTEMYGENFSLPHFKTSLRTLNNVQVIEMKVII